MEQSFPGKWKIIYFYPKDFTFVCPTEIVEFVKLAWRREHKNLNKLNHYSFGDVKGELIDQLGIRDKEADWRCARRSSSIRTMLFSTCRSTT